MRSARSTAYATAELGTPTTTCAPPGSSIQVSATISAGIAAVHASATAPARAMSRRAWRSRSPTTRTIDGSRSRAARSEHTRCARRRRGSAGAGGGSPAGRAGVDFREFRARLAMRTMVAVQARSPGIFGGAWYP